MGVVEYALGEIFQDRWAQCVSEQQGSVPRWVSLQKKRLLQLLDWQRDTAKAAITSPWVP